MTGRIARTLAASLATLLTILLADFLLLKLAPGDEADALAMQSGTATVEAMAAWRHQFGLDQPLWRQFASYVWHLCHLDLGYSPLYGMSIARLIGERLPGTLMLFATSLSLALLLGIAAGTAMGRMHGSLLDRLLSAVLLLLYSVPSFWSGLMLIMVFSFGLGLLPSGGFSTVGTGPHLLDTLAHLILPSVSLSLFFIAIYARLVRAAVIEISRQEFVRTAYAKGLGESRILVRHVLRNALLPLTSVAGSHVGAILGGSVVVETVFGWPGVGRLAFEAVQRRDFAVLLGILLLSSVTVMAANVLTDMLQLWLDPRLERQR